MQTSFFGETVDVSNVAPPTEFKPLAAGWYVAVPVDIEVVQKDYGLTSKLKFKVTEGEHAGRYVFDNSFIIVHKTNQQAHDIAQRRFRAWCDAIGSSHNVSDASVFLGKTVNIKVRVEEGREFNGKNYGPSNRVENFSAHNGLPMESTAQPAPTPRTAAAPVTAAAPQTPSAPVATTAAAAPAGKVMPWQKK